MPPNVSGSNFCGPGELERSPLIPILHCGVAAARERAVQVMGKRVEINLMFAKAGRPLVGSMEAPSGELIVAGRRSCRKLI